MTQTQMTFKAPEPPPGLELSPVPDLKGAERAAEWINEALRIPVTPRYVKDQTDAGRITYAIISGCRFYSTQGLYEFIMARTRPAIPASTRT